MLAGLGMRGGGLFLKGFVEYLAESLCLSEIERERGKRLKLKSL